MPSPYTIKSGDTLSAIALANKTDVATLSKLNGISDPNRIYAGKSLLLPDAPTPQTAVQPGITPPPSNPTNPTHGPNPVISGLGTPPSGVSTSDPIRNADVQAAADKAKADSEQAAELARTQRAAQIAELKKTYGLDTPAPTAPNLVDTYNKLRTEKGVDTLDGRLNELKASELKIQDEFKKYKDSQQGLGRTEGFVQGTIDEKGKQFQDQLDSITREKTQVVDQIQAANTVIDQVMKYTDKDYTTAKAIYDQHFQEASQLQSLLNSGDAEANRERDDARAYLTSVNTILKGSGKDFTTLDPSLQAEIQKMELKAGVPVGSTAAFAAFMPDAKPMATVNGKDANGNNVVSFIYQDANGQPGVVKTVATGTKSTVSDPGAPTHAEITASTYDAALQEAAGITQDFIKQHTEEAKRNNTYYDGKLSPEVFGKMRARVPAAYRDNFDAKLAPYLSDATKRQFLIAASGRPL